MRGLRKFLSPRGRYVTTCLAPFEKEPTWMEREEEGRGREPVANGGGRPLTLIHGYRGSFLGCRVPLPSFLDPAKNRILWVLFWGKGCRL